MTLLAQLINMTPFALNSAALFVPRDSPQSRVELLARGTRQHHGERQYKFSCDEQLPRNLPELERGLEESRRDIAGESTAPLEETVVNSKATKRNDVSLHWVSLTSHQEVELYLRVRTLNPDLDLGICLRSYI